jgi:glutathione synthase/RimK-type ligase-like ATP-grasp enzyme
LGFELPPTLVTTSPTDFLAFYQIHNGNVVSKLAGTAFFNAAGTTFCRYTEFVSKRDVGYAHSVRHAPVILQAYVPKRIELRITVVGEQVFAAEIHSQATNHTRHDWRRYDLDQTPHRPHELPDGLAQLCVRLTERLGLRYGAIDMILTPDGSYVFLEINPNGQYLWIEALTGLPISDAICDLLLSAPPPGRPDTGVTRDLRLGARSASAAFHGSSADDSARLEVPAQEGWR